MKAVENDFAKQTHGRLSVAEAKKNKIKSKGTRDEFRSHSMYHHRRKTTRQRKLQMLNRTRQDDTCDWSLNDVSMFPDYKFNMDLYLKIWKI